MNDNTHHNTHHTNTAADLEYLSGIVAGGTVLPPLPLHSFSPLNLMYCVLNEDTEQARQEFATRASEFRLIAEDQALKYSSQTTQITGPDKHHRAMLAMPEGKVTFTVLWIEKGEDSDAR